GGSVFTPERCTSIIDSLTARIGPAMAITGESPYSTANDMKNVFNNRLSTMMNAIKNESRMQLGGKTMMNAVIKSNVNDAKLFINNTNIPTGLFNGKLFAPTTLKAYAPAGYTFKGWYDTNTESCLSTNSEINIPTNDFNYTATFEEMPNAEKLSKGITPVRINEVSASNSVYVNDYFKKNDWIELVNTTNEPQDVEGMYLSDNPSTPTKYQITSGGSQASTIIPPHGHLLIWCDKLSPNKELHASFKLGAEGDELTLMAADKSWTDHFTYPEHDGNQSVGRYPDGCNDIYLFNVPTIGKDNRMTSYAVAQEENFLLGDVNGDGVVNITDVIYLVNYIMQPESTTIILKAADVNIDGNINITDAVGIINLILSY
ncbi:MAG: lamin tail domain-containing protein, partial [Prevotella sp.]|nr:lamin tail domain-containing protein [Prevotella sp.]